MSDSAVTSIVSSKDGTDKLSDEATIANIEELINGCNLDEPWLCRDYLYYESHTCTLNNVCIFNEFAFANSGEFRHKMTRHCRSKSLDRAYFDDIKQCRSRYCSTHSLCDLKQDGYEVCLVKALLCYDDKCEPDVSRAPLDYRLYDLCCHIDEIETRSNQYQPWLWFAFAIGAMVVSVVLYEIYEVLHRSAVRSAVKRYKYAKQCVKHYMSMRGTRDNIEYCYNELCKKGKRVKRAMKQQYKSNTMVGCLMHLLHDCNLPSAIPFMEQWTTSSKQPLAALSVDGKLKVDGASYTLLSPHSITTDVERQAAFGASDDDDDEDEDEDIGSHGPTTAMLSPTHSVKSANSNASSSNRSNNNSKKTKRKQNKKTAQSLNRKNSSKNKSNCNKSRRKQNPKAKNVKNKNKNNSNAEDKQHQQPQCVKDSHEVDKMQQQESEDHHQQIEDEEHEETIDEVYEENIDEHKSNDVADEENLDGEDDDEFEEHKHDDETFSETEHDSEGESEDDDDDGDDEKDASTTSSLHSQQQQQQRKSNPISLQSTQMTQTTRRPTKPPISLHTKPTTTPEAPPQDVSVCSVKKKRNKKHRTNKNKKKEPNTNATSTQTGTGTGTNHTGLMYWTCAKCTYSNQQKFAKCQMCHKKKQKPGQHHVVHNHQRKPHPSQPSPHQPPPHQPPHSLRSKSQSNPSRTYITLRCSSQPHDMHHIMASQQHHHHLHSQSMSNLSPPHSAGSGLNPHAKEFVIADTPPHALTPPTSTTHHSNLQFPNFEPVTHSFSNPHSPSRRLSNIPRLQKPVNPEPNFRRHRMHRHSHSHSYHSHHHTNETMSASTQTDDAVFHAHHHEHNDGHAVPPRFQTPSDSKPLSSNASNAGSSTSDTLIATNNHNHTQSSNITTNLAALPLLNSLSTLSSLASLSALHPSLFPTDISAFDAPLPALASTLDLACLNVAGLPPIAVPSLSTPTLSNASDLQRQLSDIEKSVQGQLQVLDTLFPRIKPSLSDQDHDQLVDTNHTIILNTVATATH